MKPNQLNSKKIALISIISGLIGGGLQILVSILLKNGYLSDGYWTIVACAFIMIATFIFVWTKKYTDVTFKKWLIIGTLTFIIMSYVIYAYILIYANPLAQEMPFLGHLLRFAAIVVCGAAASAVLGLFLLMRKPASLQVS